VAQSKTAGRFIPADNRVHVIAEAGSNHNGDVSLACDLIRVAASAGADSVKFQFIEPDRLYLPYYRKGEEKIENQVYKQRATEVLSETEWEEVFRCAADVGLPCAASIFDSVGLERLVRLGSPYAKVASTDLNNYPLLAQVAASGFTALVSTGMSTLAEIEQAVEVFSKGSALDRLVLLHCVSAYPCPLADARLYMLSVLDSEFGVPIGFSDHTLTTEASCIAVSLGARVIEKHYTVDKSLPGFDHAHALDPEELSSFVAAIRAALSACTPRDEKLTEAEKVTSVRARRGIYAARDLEPGQLVAEDDLLVVRPRAALAPGDLARVVGQTVSRRIRQYEPVDLQGGVVPAASSWEAADRYWRTEMDDKGLGNPD
jgi:N,N'-diacetyllegionaminate synthase